MYNNKQTETNMFLYYAAWFKLQDEKLGRLIVKSVPQKSLLKNSMHNKKQEWKQQSCQVLCYLYNTSEQQT
jgi:hypothetical protein